MITKLVFNKTDNISNKIEDGFKTFMQRTRIKYCGLTRKQDVQAAVAAGADALGFVFYEPSPRSVTVAQAKALLTQVPAFVSAVALVVDADEVLMKQILQLPINCIQFHGSESPQVCSQLAQGKRWIKALQVKPDVDLVEATRSYKQAGACAILLDGYDPDQPSLTGGTGKVFSWSDIPKLPLPLVLAGGLDTQNVAKAIKLASPFAVDVSGGIELIDEAGRQHKGVKDADKMLAFSAAVAQADL